MITTQLTTRQIMNRIYEDICGFDIPKNDEKLVRQSKGSPVYGEITHQSICKLLDYLNLSNRDIFFDLGSGVGKVVLQVSLLSKVKRAIGVELSTTRYQEANLALTRSLEFMPGLKNRCYFINDDLMNVDLKKATIIYTCSTAFSMAFMKKIAHRLSHYHHPFRLVSLQDLPPNKWFELVDTIKLDMSWIRKTPVHIYRRIPKKAA